jgi:tetratricopeptide (TPR) repeat protein
MQEVGIQQVFSSIEQAFKDDDLKRVEALLWPALDQFPYESRLYFYGGCIKFKYAHCAVAAKLFERAIELDDAPHIYSNLGACYRRLNRHHEGIHVLQQALDRNPEYPPALVNLGSMFVNEGCPERGIPHLEKALAIGGDEPEQGCVWNLGLLYLEDARFKDGFEQYRKGVNKERQVRIYGSKDGSIPEPELMTPETFRSARGAATVIIHGEQGIGDELMFGTILNDAIDDFEVVFECHPRLERLHQNSTWANRLRSQGRPVRIYPTRKDEWIQWPIKDKVIAEYKMPMGDLATYYRPDLDSFKESRKRHGPSYHAKPGESAGYAARLQALAGSRPIVGLATRGGVMQTSRNYRVVRHTEIDRLMEKTDALFVSLDYDDMTEIASYLGEKHGPDRFRWFPSINQHYYYDHTAALLEACDLTVTVCQSVFHLSAGMGLDTLCLTPKRCAWRYALIKEEPELSFWYPNGNVRLLRQDDPESWDGPLDKVIKVINTMSQQNQEAV